MIIPAMTWPIWHFCLSLARGGMKGLFSPVSAFLIKKNKFNDTKECYAALFFKRKRMSKKVIEQPRHCTLTLCMLYLV